MEDNYLGKQFFGNWVAVEKLGEGSFGAVYKLERDQLEEFGTISTSALKIITIPQSLSEIESFRYDGYSDEQIEEYFKNFVKDFVSEINLMAKLKANSNIVSYEDHEVIKKPDALQWQIRIRMELLTPIKQYFKSNKVYLRDVVKLGIDICKALELCQTYNIIHRDIKPENIFVSPSGDYKLGDFGIARTLEGTQGELSKKGTPFYMAPEVYRNESYSTNIDIYSLGIVLYRFLNNNRLPFFPQSKMISHREREQALNMRLCGKTLPPPVNATDRLTEIILKACAFDPEKRYSSPGELRRDLEAVNYSEKDTFTIFGENDVISEFTSGSTAFSTEEDRALERSGTIGKADIFISLEEEIERKEEEERKRLEAQKEIERQREEAARKAREKAEAEQREKELKAEEERKKAEAKRKPEEKVQLNKQKSDLEKNEAKEGDNNKKKIIIIILAIAIVDIIGVVLSLLYFDYSLGDILYCFQILDVVRVLFATMILYFRKDTTLKMICKSIFFIALSVLIFAFLGVANLFFRSNITKLSGVMIGAMINIVDKLINKRKSQEKAQSKKQKSDFEKNETKSDDNKKKIIIIIFAIVMVLIAAVLAIVIQSNNNSNMTNGFEPIATEDVAEKTTAKPTTTKPTTTKFTPDYLKSINSKTIAADICYTIGLKKDGTVLAVGDNGSGQCSVSHWTDIVSVDAGFVHTVGLKGNGTVVTTGNNEDGQCNVSDWTDIVAVAAGDSHTVGLKSDGTVVAVGVNECEECNVSDWTDIVSVDAGFTHTVGLKGNGTVVAVGANGSEKCNVSDWTDIVSVAAGINHTVGLKKDGTVVATGNNEDGQCDVSDWSDIVAVAAVYNHTVGVKSDGTVVATGDNEYGQCDVSDWSDIVAVAAGYSHTVGLKSDGTVVAVGANELEECNVSDWKGIMIPKQKRDK